MKDNENLCCSFCGKPKKAVAALIAGPTVYICSECIFLSLEILIEEAKKKIEKNEKMTKFEKCIKLLKTWILSRIIKDYPWEKEEK